MRTRPSDAVRWLSSRRRLRLEGLEVVVALLVGDVGHEGGPDAEQVGDLGRALHEAPHVHHRRGAAPERLGVAEQRRRLGDLRGHRLVGGVDVGLEPVPQRHRLGGAAQQARVEVAVVQPGDHRVAGGVDDLGALRAGVGVEDLDRADGDDRVALDEHRARVEGDLGAGHGEDDAVADEGADGHGPRLQQTVEAVNDPGAHVTRISHSGPRSGDGPSGPTGREPATRSCGRRTRGGSPAPPWSTTGSRSTGRCGARRTRSRSPRSASGRARPSGPRPPAG